MTFGLGRLGASFGKLGVGNSVGSISGFPLTAPVLAFASATDPDTDNTQDLNSTFSQDIENHWVRLVGTFGSATVSGPPYDVDISNLIDATEAGNLAAAFTTGAIPDGLVAFKDRIQAAADEGGTPESDWSNTVSKTIAAAGAFFAPRYFPNRYFAERYFG